MRTAVLKMLALGVLLAPAVLACSSSPGAGPEDAGGDGGTTASSAFDGGDAGGGPIDKAASCASTFGQDIGSVGFARFDGTLVAVVPPNDQDCAEPNRTHLVLQLSMNGAVYRMVVDVNDIDAPDTIRTRTISHALIGGPWAEGWHPVRLDYVSDLGQASADFAPTPTTQAVDAVTASLELGARVSVFATAQGEADSAHLVHRNLTDQDGAIVIDPDAESPTWLLFAFSNQSF